MITKTKLYRSIPSAIGKPCPYCRRPMQRGQGKNSEPSRDHIMPRRKGGTLAHKLICCKSCNEDKGDRTLWQWYAKLQTQKDWRAPNVAETIAALYEWLGHFAYMRIVGRGPSSVADFRK